MQSRSTHTSFTRSTAPAPKLRFVPIMHLESGDAVATLAEAPIDFTETASFGPASILNAARTNPAKWLAEQIEDIAAAAKLLDIYDRPIIVPAPISTFAHSGTAAACEVAVQRSKLCPQEICLEFLDGALAASTQDSANRVRTLRRRGFRVSIDARKAWNTPLSTALSLSIDTYRVDARHLASDAALQEQCENASAAGISVVAEYARWRDAEWLSDFGIDYALRPKADA